DASAYAAELLAESAETAPPASWISVSGNDVTVDGTTYHLHDAQAAFVKALQDAGAGVFVSGGMMGVAVQPHPERGFAKVPESIRAKIEAKPGAGYRIRPGVATPPYPKFRT